MQKWLTIYHTLIFKPRLAASIVKNGIKQNINKYNITAEQMNDEPYDVLGYKRWTFTHALDIAYDWIHTSRYTQILTLHVGMMWSLYYTYVEDFEMFINAYKSQ